MLRNPSWTLLPTIFSDYAAAVGFKLYISTMPVLLELHAMVAVPVIDSMIILLFSPSPGKYSSLSGPERVSYDQQGVFNKSYTSWLKLTH
jgi:hypothetical protein